MGSQFQEHSDRDAHDAKRDLIAGALQRRLGVVLVRRRGSRFQSRDGRKRACIAISKRYESEYQPYWYIYTPASHEFLEGADEATFVLGCIDRDEAFAMPLTVIGGFLPKLNQTVHEAGKRCWWHVVIRANEDGGLALYLPKTGDKRDLRPFAFSVYVDPKR